MSRIGRTLSAWSSLLLLAPLGVSVWADAAAVELGSLTVGLLVAYFAAVSGTSLSPWVREMLVAIVRTQRAIEQETTNDPKNPR